MVSAVEIETLSTMPPLVLLPALPAEAVIAGYTPDAAATIGALHILTLTAGITDLKLASGDGFLTGLAFDGVLREVEARLVNRTIDHCDDEADHVEWSGVSHRHGVVANRLEGKRATVGHGCQKLPDLCGVEHMPLPAWETQIDLLEHPGPLERHQALTQVGRHGGSLAMC